jgi:TonB family protein
MDHRLLQPDDEDRLTLRVPVGWLALVAALALHLFVGLVASWLPEPPKPEQRIELTLAPPPPSAKAPPAANQPAPRPTPRPRPAPAPSPRRPARPEPPPTAPVAPELPASADPADNAARLPEVAPTPTPAPPPPPSTWEERLREQLAATTPRRPPMPTGALAPSTGELHRVAGNDPRLNDEQTERRLAEDFGPFFRRGLGALRGHWHPQDVLNKSGSARRCGVRKRTTFAVAVLDREGHVIDVDLKTPSGCPDLDDEAIAAFKRVAHFPHPPAGIFVAPDGTPTETARYPVRFIVTFDGGLHLDWR